MLGQTLCLICRFVFWVCVVSAIWCLFVGCASGLRRPDANLYFMNAAAHQMQGNNILHDYDDNGVRTAKGFTVFQPFSSIDDIDGGYCMRPAKVDPSFKNTKVSLADARSYINKHCKCE